MTGEKRHFQYLDMLFSLNDAMRVLTKLLKFPFERWRKDGITLFIHVDDRIRFVKGKEKALAACRKVREELGKYGLLASEEK